MIPISFLVSRIIKIINIVITFVLVSYYYEIGLFFSQNTSRYCTLKKNPYLFDPMQQKTKIYMYYTQMLTTLYFIF